MLTLTPHPSGDCHSCTAGYYCGTTGLTSPTGQCAAGFYCSGGANVSAPQDGGLTGDICPQGRYCPVGSFFGLYHTTHCVVFST